MDKLKIALATIWLASLASLAAAQPIEAAENNSMDEAQWMTPLKKADSLQTVEQFLTAICEEVGRPAGGDRIRDSYLTTSERNLESLALKLADLGPVIVGPLTDTLRFLPAEVQKWIVFALGFQRQESVVGRLRNIAVSDSNIVHRVIAVNALATYEDSSNIDLFQQALADTSSMKVYSDTYTEDGINYSYVRPVREAAYRALRQLGVPGRIDSDGNFVIEE